MSGCDQKQYHPSTSGHMEKGGDAGMVSSDHMEKEDVASQQPRLASSGHMEKGRRGI